MSPSWSRLTVSYREGHYRARPALFLSIVILVVMGSILEGAAALIIFGPLLIPVARQIWVDPLHCGVILIGGVKLEETVWPMMKYLGLLLVCPLITALIPQISTALPRALRY